MSRFNCRQKRKYQLHDIDYQHTEQDDEDREIYLSEMGGSMRDFIAKYPVQNAGGPQVGMRKMGVSRTVYFPVIKGDQECPTGFEQVYRAIQETDENDEFQFCAYIGSAIALIAPSLEAPFRAAMMELGCTIQELILPDEEGLLMLQDTDLPSMDFPQHMVVWSIFILCMFKNVSDANFTNFMDKRLKALMQKANVSAQAAIEIPISIKQSQMIRSRLGQQTALCESVIRYLLENSRGKRPFNEVCLYVAEIISWAEMASIVFIFQMLICTNSLVLQEPEVKDEVYNLVDALQAITACPAPQFFRYFASPSDRLKIARNRFPILTAVAVSLGRDLRTEFLANFAVSGNVRADSE